MRKKVDYEANCQEIRKGSGLVYELHEARDGGV